MAECRYFPECQRCNEVGDSWIPCIGGSDGTRCLGYEPMPDVDALVKLADEMTVEKGDIWRWSSRIRDALGVDK